MTPEQAHSGYRTVAGGACSGVCHLWSHRTDRTDPALSTCAYCGAVEGSPAGLCATMSTERSPFSHPPKPGGWGPCPCGATHTPPVQTTPTPAPVPYMGYYG